MKIAITIWNDRVSPVFDVTAQAMLFESVDGMVISERLLHFPQISAVGKLICLREALTDVLICGAISSDIHLAAVNGGVNVYPFIAGDVRAVLQGFLAGRINEAIFAMPGCGCRSVCSGPNNHGRGRRRTTGSAPFCDRKPE